MAMSLGLEVMLKPIVKEGDWDIMSRKYLLPAFPKKFYYHDNGLEENADIEDFEFLFKVEPSDIGKINWCETHKLWHPAAATMHYGNDHTLACFYQAAAILVGIPHWNKVSNHRSTFAGNDVIRKYVNFCDIPSKYWNDEYVNDH